jgi:PAS domain S-box-containing protein
MRVIRSLSSVVLLGLVVSHLLAGTVWAEPLQVNNAAPSQDETLSPADHDWLAAHGPIRLGLPSVPWPPFDMFSDTGDYMGISADYITLLSHRLGFTVEQVRLPSFEAALDALRQGSIDIMVSMARTPERETFAVFTLPYIRSQPVIICRKDDDSIHALADLSGKTVAIERGFAAADYLKGLSNLSLIEYVGTKEALEAVSLGKANAYVGSLISSTYVIDREAMSNLEVRTAAGLPISDIRFAVKKSEPELARILDHGIASISQQEHDNIRKKWIGVAGLGVDWHAVLRIAIPIAGALISIILVTLIWNGRLHRQVARRRAAEEALAAQMNFQVALLENLPALVAYKDTEARFLGCNRAYEEAFGVERDRLIGKTTLDIEGFPDGQRDRGYAQDVEVLRTGEALHRQEQLAFVDGQAHDVLLWRIPFSLPDGTPAGLLSITVDVSAQKEAERALADQLTYQKALIDTIPSPIYIKDSEARYIGCNQAYEEAFGVTRAEIVGKTVLAVPHIGDARRQQLYERDLELLRTKGHAFRADKTAYADGEERDSLYWIHSFDLADGGVGGLVGVLVDISETKALERQAQEAERRLREIADSAPGVVYQLRVNPDGSRAYTFMTDGLQALRGFSHEQALHDYHGLWEQILDEDKPGLDRVVREAVTTHRPMRHEFRIRMPDGTIKWLQSAAEASPASDGAVMLNGYWVDVTQHREMEAELDKARVAADAANRAKSSFLAAMSHEIRTPMNGVLGMLELLSLTRLDSEQRANVEVIQESGRSLLRIINDILDFSKIEAGMLELRPEPTSIADVVRGVREIYSGTASAKDLQLTATVDPRISPAVMVDPLRLRQILNNFLSNAIKFTAEGSVAINIELVDRKEGGDTVSFAVTDTGIGISEENQKKLFQPFAQAEGDTTHRFGGTGLGLVICRRIAELMGGTIEMESALGRGTTMTLRVALPITDPALISARDEGRTLSAVVLEQRRPPPDADTAVAEGTLVLIVDDHPTNRLLIKRQLGLLGYAAESAENGREAFERWKTGRLGLIITDCHMPEMDGYELTRAIRDAESGNGGRRIPIIACTANVLEGEAEACLACGMDGYLAKPVELPALLGLLDRWLPLPEASSLEEPPSTGNRAKQRLSADAAAPSPIDRAKLAEVSLGDAAFEHDMLTGFRDSAETDREELTAALASGDYDKIAKISHRIKGASRTIGATSLADISEQMERAGRAADRAAVATVCEPLFREIDRLTKFLEPL